MTATPTDITKPTEAVDAPASEQVTARPASPHDRHFRTDHLMADLKGRSVRGGAITLTAQAVKFVLQTGSTMVLARLLTPADFGLIAMVSAFTGFVGLFKDLGLSMATIQRPEITHAQVSTLFWINVALSALLALIAAALAPAVAWFYGEPQLTWITIAIAGTFIFGGLSAQHTALLRRQMRFKSLASIEIASLAIGVAVAITLALLTRSYWALVAMTAAQAATTALLSFIASGWVPGRPQKRSGTRAMIAFGGNLTGFNLLNYFSRNADNVLIGWWWGTASLGLYSKAYSLLMMPLTQINGPLSSVAIPALSRLQNEPIRYRRAFLKLLNRIAMVTMPLMAFLICAADQVILLTLGRQWEAAAPIFMWLGVAGILQPISNACGWLYVTQGRTREFMHWGVIAFSLTIIAFIIGLPWGAIGVAASYALSGIFFRTPLMWWRVGRKGPVHIRDIAITVLPYGIAAFTSIALDLFVIPKSLAPSDVSAVGIAVGIVLLPWLFVYAISSHVFGRHT